MSRPRSANKGRRIVSYIHPAILADFEREARRQGVSVSSLAASVLSVHSPRNAERAGPVVNEA